MSELDRIEQLLFRLTLLEQQQEKFSNEIQALRGALENLKYQPEKVAPKRDAENADLDSPVVKVGEKEPTKKVEDIPVITEPAAKPVSPTVKPALARQKSKLEAFIGENLISKIGIAVLVIGVGIGVKYSIDHDLISPLTRILLAYVLGIGVLLTGIKLKARYQDLSAVLVSGAMAIMYVVTYLAYSLYGFIPQVPAFFLMFVFTAFVVLAALQYNRQIVAHIGLVGAYMVPFLLSDGSGRYVVLFSYMLLINGGILYIAMKKYWLRLYYAAFIISWLIVSSWTIFSYQSTDFFLPFMFITLFFLMFYIILLWYNIKNNKRFTVFDIVLLLINAFVYYGLGYYMVDGSFGQLLGLYTVFNAVIHFVVARIIFTRGIAEKSILYLIIGMVLSFITIAIPVQLEGGWVTLMWSLQSLLMFWIGRTRQQAIYEKLSYVVMVFALLSILHQWELAYVGYYDEHYTWPVPVLNTDFLTGMLTGLAFTAIAYLHFSQKYQPLFKERLVNIIIKVVASGAAMLIVYKTIHTQIVLHFDEKYYTSSVLAPDGYKVFNEGYKWLKQIWTVNYTMVFTGLLMVVIWKGSRKRNAALAILLLQNFALLFFLTTGLWSLSELREYNIYDNTGYFKSTGSVVVRYISVPIAVIVLFLSSTIVRNIGISRLFTVFEVWVHVVIVWLLSSELLAWMNYLGYNNNYRTGLSILWGLYALMLVFIGMRQKKTHLRIASFVLFGITLLKLFFYDISQLDTIGKTIVFVSLGILLLIVSYLYNKQKNNVKNEDTV